MTSGSKNLLLIFFSFLFVLPIAVIGSSNNGSGINITLSDLLVAITLLIFCISGTSMSRHEQMIPIQVFFVSYCILIACFTAMQYSDITPILSLIKFVKVFFAFFAGYALAIWFGRDNVLTALANAAVAYILLLPVSEFIFHQNFKPRLGEEYFYFNVYGFPNSPSSYLIFLLCLALLKKRTLSVKFALLFVMAVFAAGSMSKAAILLYLIAFPLLIFMNTNTISKVKIILYITVGAVITLPYFLDLIFFIDVVEGVNRRLESAERKADFSNGRFRIFAETIDLLSIKPFFGYGFFSYSNVSIKGTPHNQYLEVWFKTGLIGLICYLSIFFIGVVRVVNARLTLSKDLSVGCLYMMFLIILIGNMTQPNLSYSVTGNLVFLIFGLFAILPSSKRKYFFN